MVLQAMVDVAKEVGADAVAHGCTGKGNDQVCLIAIVFDFLSIFLKENLMFFLLTPCRYGLNSHSLL